MRSSFFGVRVLWGFDVFRLAVIEFITLCEFLYCLISLFD